MPRTVELSDRTLQLLERWHDLRARRRESSHPGELAADALASVQADLDAPAEARPRRHCPTCGHSAGSHYDDCPRASADNCPACTRPTGVTCTDPRTTLTHTCGVW